MWSFQLINWLKKSIIFVFHVCFLLFFSLGREFFQKNTKNTDPAPFFLLFKLFKLYQQLIILYAVGRRTTHARELLKELLKYKH